MNRSTYRGFFFKLSIITSFLLCEWDIAAATCSQPNTRICYRQVSHVTYYTTYSRGSRRESYGCGWWDWNRCHRTVYYHQSSSASRVHYTTEMICCNGYTQVNGQCEPLCNPNCEYGYTCVAPNMCRRGVQLTLDGVNYPNNSLIQFDNIYYSSDYCHSLLCTTDRVPCCSVSQGGNWYQLASNGSQLQLATVPHTMEEEYYQNMGNDGTLRLLRQDGVRDAPTNSSVYCCQLSDAALLVHTLCVSIVESSPGVWLELDGQLYANNSAIELREVYESPTDSHSLMCVTPKRPCCVTPYRMGQWIYPNQSIISNDASGNSFYRTRRDDGTVRLHRRGVASLAAAMGQYCCEILNDNYITHRLCVHFVDNSPIQVSSSLTSQRYSNNSIVRLSEVYLNEFQSLICATDKRPCCSSQNAWHYQNGSVVPSLSEGYDFYAEGRSDGRVHLYIRNVTVTFVNSIQFCCELPNINDLVQKVCVYLDPTVEVTDATISINKFIEFRLFGIRDCYDWVHLDTLLKEDDLLNAITDGVEKSCQCGFSMTYFATGAFQCFQESAERAVTYRTNLRAPNGSVDFAEKISLWLSTGPSVQVAGVLLNLDSMCNLIITSFGDPECGEGIEQEITTETFTLPVTAQSSELHTIIGAGVGFVVMILVVFFCLLVIILVPVVVLWKKFKAKNKQYEITQPSNTKTSHVDVPVSTKASEDNTYAEIADIEAPGEYEAVVSSQAGSVTYHKTLPDQSVGGYQALSELDSKSVYTLPNNYVKE